MSLLCRCAILAYLFSPSRTGSQCAGLQNTMRNACWTCGCGPMFNQVPSSRCLRVRLYCWSTCHPIRPGGSTLFGRRRDMVSIVFLDQTCLQRQGQILIPRGFATWRKEFSKLVFLIVRNNAGTMYDKLWHASLMEVNLWC